jgi:hypothetical protein
MRRAAVGGSHRQLPINKVIAIGNYLAVARLMDRDKGKTKFWIIAIEQ